MGLLASIAQYFRNIQNPAHPLVPDEWDDFAQTGGVPVDPQSVLSYPPVWRAINLLANDVGRISLNTYRRTDSGKQLARDHFAYGLLRHKPSPFMTAFWFKHTLTWQALLFGNSFAKIRRNPDASASELNILDPTLVLPQDKNGVLIYRYQPNTDREKIWRADEVLRIRGLGDEVKGYHVVDKAKESLSIGMACQKYAARFFHNSAVPEGVLEHPGKLSLQAREQLLNSWYRRHGRPDNSHKTGILQEGMRYSKIGASAEESQLIQQRQFELRMASNWIGGIPPHKLGDDTRTSFSSLEQENQSYLDQALDPLLVIWEEECRDKLLTEQQKDDDTHFFHFERKEILRANMSERYRAHAIAIEKGFMNRNEVREEENLNSMGADGDRYYVPVNIEPIDKPDKPDNLQGQQIQSLIALVNEITSGAVSKDSGKAMIAAALPSISTSQINSIVDNLKVKELDTNYDKLNMDNNGSPTNVISAAATAKPAIANGQQRIATEQPARISER